MKKETVADRPIEGMSAFLELLGEAGVADEDLKKMIATNPAKLLDLKDEIANEDDSR